LQQVSKAFDDVQAVDDVSLDIDRGEVVGFLGPNGAGKTTTMRLITQALQPDAGRIEIDGTSTEEAPLECRRRIGYLPETNPLYDEMLVSEFLAYVGRLRGLDDAVLPARMDPAVEQTGIGDVFHRPIGQLSKGYRQRVGLAQAILAEPEVLILDEPTEGLDPNQRVEIRNLITHLGADRTVLLSTHVLQEVQATCSRLLVIHHGRLIADGAVGALLEGRGRAVGVTVELQADVDAARTALEGLRSVRRLESEPGAGPGRARFRIVGAEGSDPRPEIFGLARDRDWTLWELRREHGDLEAFFRELTEDV
jgi:ABC-2 type transport system ATP-binding protein